MNLKSFPILTSGKIDRDQLAKLVEDVKPTPFRGNNRVLEILSTFTEVDNSNNGRTIVSLGLDSLGTLLFLQKLAGQCVDVAHEGAFIDAALSRMGDMTLLDLERLVIRYGGAV